MLSTTLKLFRQVSRGGGGSSNELGHQVRAISDQRFVSGDCSDCVFGSGERPRF